MSVFAGHDELFEYRRQRYLALGFGAEDAEALARAKEQERDSKGRLWTRPLYPGRVEKALRAGCSHELALAIFT